METVRSVKRIGQEQFDAFTKECLIDRTKSMDETIHHNKLPLFGTSTHTASKGKQQLTSLKNDVELFSRLHISCQTRDGSDPSAPGLYHGNYLTKRQKDIATITGYMISSPFFEVILDHFILQETCVETVASTITSFPE